VDSQTSSGRIGARGEALVDQIKEIVRKGNVSRIQVTKEDELILNIPLSAGIIGAVVGPWVMLLGVVASFGFKCQVSVVKDTGEVIDITDKAGNFYEDAKVKGSEMADKFKEKAPDVYETIVEKGGEFHDGQKGPLLFGNAYSQCVHTESVVMVVTAVIIGKYSADKLLGMEDDLRIIGHCVSSLR
jgi:hypothetical protein